jgi:hypothetical protein
LGGNWAEAADRPAAARSAASTGYGACLITLRTVSLLGRNWGVSPSSSAAQEAFLQFAQFGRRGGAELVAEALAQLFVDA